MNKHRILIFNQQNLIFQFFQNEQKTDECVLAAGYQFVADSFFKGSMPAESEIEYAINFIEDELMSHHQLVNDQEDLLIQTPLVNEVFQNFGITHTTIQKEEIEELFNSVARSLLNKQAAQVSGINPVSFSIVLVIREIVHHLKFSTVTLLSEMQDD